MNKKLFATAKNNKDELQEFPYYYGGDNAFHGYDMIPRILFEKQGEMGLNDGELNVFLHFLHGLSKARKKKPYCYETLQSPKFLSNKTGKSQRQITRSVKGLTEKGFIKPIKEYKEAGGARIRSHNIEPGIKKLMVLAKQLRKEKETKQTKLTQVELREFYEQYKDQVEEKVVNFDENN
jgi:hypothetical protein